MSEQKTTPYPKPNDGDLSSPQIGAPPIDTFPKAPVTGGVPARDVSGKSVQEGTRPNLRVTAPDPVKPTGGKPPSEKHGDSIQTARSKP